MSTRSQRGRAVQVKKSGSSRTIYIVVAAVVLIGVAVLATISLQNRATEEALPGRPPARPAFAGETGVENGFFTKGSASAPVVVTEYSDFQCPGCAFFATSLAQQFEADYVETGRVRFVYHEFPLNGHANAVPSAAAARCAGDQGADKYWAFHDLLFTNQRQWSAQPNPRAQFVAYARQLNLDVAAFEACVQENRHRDAVVAAGRTATGLGLSGTPSFAVNGQVVDTRGAGTVNDIEQRLRQAVDAALAGQ